MDPDPELVEFAKYIAMMIVVFVMLQDVRVWTELTKPGDRNRIFPRERRF